ncbi:PAC2 family protein [Candidatus Parvarchaeota archaeon]|nr:PAC2 family protein [Candidatus Parvarchaeota archaeon]
MAKYFIKDDLKSPEFLIISFPTAGYVSLLVSKYLEDKALIKEVGHIDLENTNPLAIISDSRIGFPVRILGGKSAVFVSSQFPLLQRDLPDVVKQIFSIFKEHKFKEIIAIDGMEIDSPKEKSEVYYASNAEQKSVEGAKKLANGAIAGLNSSLSLEGKKLGIPVTILMAETHSEIPDGIAAASLISVLGGMIGMKVDTQELVTEYKKTLNRINEMIKRINKKEEPRQNDIYG